MEMQINDIESDLDDDSILQTEDGNTSDIIINYSSDASSIGTIIYDNNLHNDCDQGNTPWGKTVNIRHIILIISMGRALAFRADGPGSIPAVRPDKTYTVFC